MTLESTASKNRFVGNGRTTQFPFSFKVWKTDQVAVYVGDGEVERDVSSTCEISLASTGGVVSFSKAPASGTVVVICRKMPFVQEDDYRNGTLFDAEDVEDRFDQDCAERQELRYGLSRSLKLPVTSSKTSEEWVDEFFRARNDTLQARADAVRLVAGVDGANIVNIKAYGAIGDGYANDTDAWNEFMAASGGMKYIPAGDYLVDGVHKVFAHGAWVDTSTSDAFNELKIYAPQQWYASASESLVDDGYYDTGVPYKISGECNVLIQGDTVVLIDTGGSNRSKMTKAFLQAIGVKHIDYIIFSHYHYDHVTYFTGFAQNNKSSLSTLAEDFDLSRCKFYLPQPRSSADARVQAEPLYGDVLSKLAELGKVATEDYFFPDDLDVLQIGSAFRITFLNAGTAALQEVLAIDQRQRPDATEMKINDCSMGCLVEHGNTRIFFSGDMEMAAEERIADKFSLVSSFNMDASNDNASVDETGESAGGSYDDLGELVTDSFIENYTLPVHASSETVYEKIQNVDLYKINHHGVNFVGSNTSWLFHKFVRPRFAYAVAQYGYLSHGDQNGMDRRNLLSFHGARVYNSYYELVEFVSRGNGIEVVRGQEEGFTRNGCSIKAGDVMSPYNGINTGSGGKWWSFIGIDFSAGYRQASFLLYVSTTRISSYASGVFEVSINASSRTASADNFDSTNTRIRTIYSTQRSGEFRDNIGIAYFGTDSNGISHYEICFYKSGKDNHIKVTVLGANYINNGVDCYQTYGKSFWRYKDSSDNYQLYSTERGESVTASAHDSSRVTVHFYNEYTLTVGAYPNYLPWYNKETTISNFNNCVVPGRYHVRFTPSTENAPWNTQYDGVDGILCIDKISSATSVSSYTRITQTMVVHGPAEHCGRTFYRGIMAGGSAWSGWRELTSNDPYADNKQSLGSADARWSAVYAATGSIQTSDARKKTSVADVSGSLCRAWGRVGYKVFQFVDAVAEKGEAARLHVGVIAQDVQAAFEAEGLDAKRFGLFCHDEWEEKRENIDVVDVEAVTDDMGNIISPAETHKEDRVVRPSGDIYSIRYEEALALECAYLRSRISAMQSQIDQLVATVAQLTSQQNN